MKKIILLLSLFISGITSVKAQICNIGNEDTTGFNYNNGPIGENNLLGIKFSLTDSGVLNSLNLIAKDIGAHVQMVVYSDSTGVPWNLVVVSNISTVVSGIVSLPVTATQLLPGDYWIMAIYDTSGNHTYRKDDSTYVYYTYLPFGDTIPANATTFTGYFGRNFTYFMEIICGTLNSVSKIDNNNSVHVYPNPCSSCEITGAINANDLIVTDILGRKQQATCSQSAKGYYINLPETCNGLFFIRNIKTSEVVKFVKE